MTALREKRAEKWDRRETKVMGKFLKVAGEKKRGIWLIQRPGRSHKESLSVLWS
jgi:hypothetical protein